LQRSFSAVSDCFCYCRIGHELLKEKLTACCSLDRLCPITEQELSHICDVSM
jgi:hypothetical protein